MTARSIHRPGTALINWGWAVVLLGVVLTYFTPGFGWFPLMVGVFMILAGFVMRASIEGRPKRPKDGG